MMTMKLAFGSWRGTLSEELIPLEGHTEERP